LLQAIAGVPGATTGPLGNCKFIFARNIPWPEITQPLGFSLRCSQIARYCFQWT